MNKKKKTILIVALLLVVFIGSISYALWSVTLEQTDSNVIKTGCFTVDMVEETDEINLPEEYPVLDSEGKTYTPFTFTIQNTCTIDSSYSVNLDVDAATTLGHEYVKVALNNDAIRVLTEYEKATNEDKYQLTTGTLAGASSEGAEDGESVTYNLRLWLDADTPESQMSKDFIAKVVVENITTSIKREVLATVDFSKTESDNVTLNYYSDGLVELVGTGNVKDQKILEALFMNMIANNEKLGEAYSQLANFSPTVQGLLEGTAYASFGSYKAMTETYFNGLVDLSGVTNNEELYEIIIDAVNNNSTMFTEEELSKLPEFIELITTTIKPITALKISEGITSTGSRTYTYFENVDIILPSTIEKIDEAPFAYAYSNVFLNDELESIYVAGAFRNTRFKTIELPSNLRSMGNSTFESSSIESIVLPKNIKHINSYTFHNTPNLKSVVVLGNITQIDPTAFDNLSTNPNLVIKFAMSEEDKTTILDATTKQPFDFTNYNIEWGYTE